MAESTSRKKYIVNLGCGYDPLPFTYLSASSDAVFIDVDYPDLIRHKTSIIRNTPALVEPLGPLSPSTTEEIRAPKYYALGCDLSNLPLFDQILRTVDPHIDEANILFISEVAITYMVPLPLSYLIASRPYPRHSYTFFISPR